MTDEEKPDCWNHRSDLGEYDLPAGQPFELPDEGPPSSVAT
ncbi:hypothetical protein [Planomonospora sp. ID82291]|nr:hypothetical protein [Planomonospora sp. ID82291]